MQEKYPETHLKSLTFLSDHYELKGFLHLPGIPNPSVVIGSHGLFSSGDSPKQIALAEKCNALGIGFFRFDHRGCGKSDGLFKEVTSLKGRHTDLMNAIQTIEDMPETGDRIGIFGSSMGGATALSVASKFNNINALVTVAAPIRSQPVLESAEKSDDLRNLPLSFYQKNLYFDISHQLAGISRILLFHGDQDDVVPVSNAHDIFAVAEEPKKLIIQKGGDHPISAPDYQEQFILEASNWFARWLNR